MKQEINRAATLYRPAIAVRIAAELSEADPNWTYTALNPKGEAGPYSAVEVRDEEGELVGYWRDESQLH